MNKKGETFGCLVGMSAVAFFIIGLLICIFSRFACIELDYSEQQRTVCETKANFGLIFGFIIIIGSIGAMMFSKSVLGFSNKESNKI